MEKRRKLLIRISVFAALLGIYPLCVILFTWSNVLRSDFKGGRHGQLDAYRHVLASATVSYTLGEWAVNLVTRVFESNNKDSNRMDRHNNVIGGKIGSTVRSFRELEPAVQQSVMKGRTDATEPKQITWLPMAKWRDGNFW